MTETTDRTIADLARGFVSEGRVLSEAELRSLIARKSARRTRRPNMMAALAGITPFGGGPVMLFASGEHSVIPFQLQYPDGPVDARTYQLVLNASGQNGLAPTYGQIIALAGDFYADPTKPISNQVGLAAQQSQVTANFNSLATGQASKTEVPKLLDVMQKEISASQLAELRGLQPSAPYAIKGSHWDLQYNGITGGSYTDDTDPGRYELIAATNWDHFGADAITSYTAAHAAALDLAVAPGTDNAQLDQAYALNAFADHYLTDLFSSGHLRTPRRQLYERQYGPTGPVVDPKASAWTPDSAVSGLLAKFMHDEDSLNGLWVRNSKGDSWLCYGDARYRDPQNYANAALVQQALKISTDEIYQAFTTKTLPNPYEALALVPVLNRDWNSSENYSPLFLLSGADVLNRNDESNLLDYTHSTFYLYTAYHQAPDTPILGTSLFPTGGTKLPGGPPTAMPAMTGPDIPPAPSVDPIGAQGGIGLTPARFAFTLDAQGRIDVVKYQSGGIGWRSKVNGNWSGWQIIGTPDTVISSGFTSVPTLVSGATNALDVFATGAGGIMQQNSYRSGSWKQPVIGWKTPLPGNYASALTAVVPGSGKFAVFGLGMQNDLNQNSFDGTSWSGPTALKNPQPLLSIPAVVVRAKQTGCDLFGPGSDGHVWYRGAGNGTAWKQLTLPGQVAVNSLVAAASWGPNRLDWFARNLQGTLSHCWYDQPNWDANGEIWANCQSISAPAVASTGGNCLDVLWIAPDGTVKNRMYTKSGGWVFKTLASGIKAASPPVVAVSGTRIDLMYLGVDGQLYHASRATTGASWSGWGQVGAFTNNGPVGYLYCVAENQSMTFASSVDLAYGVNGQYNYLYRVTGTITFNNATFQDPAVGSGKFGYFRPAVYPAATIAPTGYTLCASENQSYYFSSPTDVAYGANGNYTFRAAVTGNFLFSNQTFGVDPDPGTVKAGYYRTN